MFEKLFVKTSDLVFHWHSRRSRSPLGSHGRPLRGAGLARSDLRGRERFERERNGKDVAVIGLMMRLPWPDGGRT